MSVILPLYIILSRSGAEARNPCDEAIMGIISRTLRRGVYPELALSQSKGEAEERLRVTFFGNKSAIRNHKI